VGGSLAILQPLVVAVVAAAEPSVASDPSPMTAVLDWEEGPPGCPSAGWLQHAVEAVLARPVFGAPGAADVRLSGRLEPAPPPHAWRAVLSMRDPSGRRLGVREIIADEPDCAALGGAVALVLAMMVDLSAEEAELYLAGTAPESAVPWNVSVELSASSAHGLVGDVAFGPRLGFGFEPPAPLRLLVDLSVIPASTVESDGGGALFSAGLAGLHLCARLWSGDRLRSGLCGGVQGGWVYAEGRGLDTAASATRALAQVAVRAELLVRLYGPLWGQLIVDGSVPVIRHDFYFLDPRDRRRTIYGMWPVIPMISLGLAWRLDL